VSGAPGSLVPVVTALYRRYRPETFAELIGQSQVTDPLRTALRNDRVNHAYLFSGPRGCGKTTSARILARCLNCVEGPTDTPCGVCPSCIELSRDGGGSMDVVEIDAASHGGVDDARDLRERAIFAPARDRYKIFILDEAHMVTASGFNALLKIVEEPPEHVKFIFATTEPEKVIGTIRSRTHHYPFRLVPPAQMLEYVQQLSESEKVEVEPGVLPLVVRAGGGSVRDTLSLLDQLIAGSEGASVLYNRAVALLGYTHGTLLGEVVDAIGMRDAPAAFASVDRVIQTGQDPRRFVEDLLERLRDLIVVSALNGSTEGAAAVLRGIQQDELERMAVQAHQFGTAELSRAADVVNSALTEMTGATSPRLHLELMIARVLLPASDDSQRGALARVERLERRIGVAGAEANSTAETAAIREPAVRQPEAVRPPAPATPALATPALATPALATPAPATSALTTPAATAASPVATSAPISASVPTEAASAEAPAHVQAEARTVTLAQLKDAWPEILEVLSKASRPAWMVVFAAKPVELRDDMVLRLAFQSQNDIDSLKQQSAPGKGVADLFKQAVFEVLGFKPGLLTMMDSQRQPEVPTLAASAAKQQISPQAAAVEQWATSAPAANPADASPAEASPADDSDAPEPTEPDIEPPVPNQPASVNVATWATAVVTDSEPETKPAAYVAPKVAAVAPAKIALKRHEPKPVVEVAEPTITTGGNQRYGEAVVREILNASFIEEQIVVPAVQPREE
jgi:DNA polymerase-3 subunit gamma/tau